MSDANAEDEGYLIRSGQDLASDVLVIGRNGRLGRTSLELLFAVKPRHCIVLAGSGANRPSRGLLERIDGKNTGANVYRTDIHGIIKMISDGNVVTVEQ
jgi:beta-lactamase superfamily II metal-dependent hydrolase